jgi:cytochrome c-type biogenesis protein
VSLQVILLTLTYSLGTGIPLLLIAYGGNQALIKFPALARHTEAIKKAFGVLMILTSIGLAFNTDRY